MRRVQSNVGASASAQGSTASRGTKNMLASASAKATTSVKDSKQMLSRGSAMAASNVKEANRQEALAKAQESQGTSIRETKRMSANDLAKQLAIQRGDKTMLDKLASMPQGKLSQKEATK